jgi:hypothetical protein
MVTITESVSGAPPLVGVQVNVYVSTKSVVVLGFSGIVIGNEPFGATPIKSQGLPTAGDELRTQVEGEV